MPELKRSHFKKDNGKWKRQRFWLKMHSEEKMKYSLFRITICFFTKSKNIVLWSEFYLAYSARSYRNQFVIQMWKFERFFIANYPRFSMSVVYLSYVLLYFTGIVSSIIMSHFFIEKIRWNKNWKCQFCMWSTRFSFIASINRYVVSYKSDFSE